LSSTAGLVEFFEKLILDLLHGFELLAVVPEVLLNLFVFLVRASAKVPVEDAARRDAAKSRMTKRAHTAPEEPIP